MKKNLCLGIFAFILIAFFGCNAGTQVNPSPLAKDFNAKIGLEILNLSGLENGHYEGWLLADGQTTSFGKFNINEDGKLIDLDGKLIEKGEFSINYQASQIASRIIITAEENEDKNPNRSATVVLEGNIDEMGNSELYFAAYDTESMAGSFELRTYSAENNDKMAANGIWFSTLSEENKRRPLLDLPDIKQGWIYESWLERDGKFLSLGKFGSANTVDMGKSYSLNPDVLPTFPGDDLLVGYDEMSGFSMPFKVNEKTTRIFISLEPYSENGVDLSGKMPFSLILLEAQINEKTPIKKPQYLINVALNSVPGGSISFEQKESKN